MRVLIPALFIASIVFIVGMLPAMYYSAIYLAPRFGYWVPPAVAMFSLIAMSVCIWTAERLEIGL